MVALYYNKKMFDAAGIPYPDDTWDWAKLVEVAKQLTLKDAEGKVTQWGFYTETTDMENYWSVARLAERRRDHLGRQEDEPGRRATRRPAGIQFLQDLIWKDKVMPDPAVWPADSGDAFEQGKAAMEANGSWLVATHSRRASTSGSPRCRRAPAGRATSINPTGAVVYKGTKNPDAAWEFVKYLASPAAQTKIMELKASMPANKEVLDRPVRDLVRRRQGPRRRDRLRPPQALVQGLRRVVDRRSRRRSTRTSSPTRRRRPSRRSTDVLPQLDGILAGQ